MDTLSVVHANAKKLVYKRLFLLLLAGIWSGYLNWFDHSGLASQVYFGLGLNSFSDILLIVTASYLLFGIFDFVAANYRQSVASKQIPLKNYFQILKLILFMGSSILILSLLVSKPPVYFLTAIGASAAVLLLIFKETVIGSVASIQLINYDLLRHGDWIEVPNFGVDGQVVDVSLNTIQVKNFDDTIVTVPSYALLTQGLKNWRNIQVSGGRRVKRSIFIDMGTIKLCDEVLLNKISAVYAIPFEAYSDKKSIANINLLRAYLEQYLEQHPDINKKMHVLIRELQGTSVGMPLEVYFLTNATDLKKYENIQAAIFDHIHAILPLFGLKVFQLT